MHNQVIAAYVVELDKEELGTLYPTENEWVNFLLGNWYQETKNNGKRNQQLLNIMRMDSQQLNGRRGCGGIGRHA